MTNKSFVGSLITRYCCTVGMSFIGQRHKLSRSDEVGDGFDGFPQQHRHCAPQPQRHFGFPFDKGGFRGVGDEVEAFALRSSPTGKAESCHARTPAEMRNLRVIDN